MLGHARPSGRLSRGSNSARHSTRDSGVTFVELLVTIVLTGTVVLAVLVAVRTTTRATITDRDHAKAFEWLQAAADNIYETSRVPCSPTNAIASANAAEGAYRTAALAAALPSGWNPGGVTVDVAFIAPPSADGSYTWNDAACWEECPECGATSQRVTISVTNPRGGIESLETVKHEG